MGKQPGFYFFPGDWLKDPALRSCDIADRGSWIDLLCFMWESEERGKLVLNGRPMTIEEIANLLHVDCQTASKTIAKLIANGVASVEQNTGKIISRRLVREETDRQEKANRNKEIAVLRSEAGKKGASKRWQKEPSSSSLSSSESLNINKEALKKLPVDNSKSQELFKQRIVQAVASMSNGDGEKSKAIMTWVNGKRDQINGKLPDMEWLTQTVERLKIREGNGIRVQSYGKYLDTLYSKVRTDWLQGEAKRTREEGQTRNRQPSNPISIKEIIPKYE